MEEADERFAQQQELIEQLKQMVRDKDNNDSKMSNTDIEKRLKTKEKELQNAASKLSHIKLQNKAKSVANKVQKSPSTPEAKEEVVSPNNSSPNSNRGKMVLLKKRLDENRQKFEKREKEIFQSQKGIEKTVQSLKQQLEERDAVIEELNNPKKEGSNNDHVNMDSQEMFDQIMYKDNKILELNDQILDLETNVIDAQETISEKEEIIQARNKAIKLITEDLSRKNKTVVDDLDMTREQMRIMQQEFVGKESEWKSERNQLLNALEKLESKSKATEDETKELHDTCNSLEASKDIMDEKNSQLKANCLLLQENIQKQAFSFKDEISKMTEKLNEKRNEIEVLEQNLQSSKLDYEKVIKDIESRNDGVIKAYEERLDKMTKDNEIRMYTLEEQLKEVKELSDNVESNNSDHLEIVEKQLVEIESLKELLAEKDRLHTEAIDSLNQQLSNLGKDFENLEVEKDNIEKSFVEVEGGLKNMLMQRQDDFIDFENNLKSEKEKLNMLLAEKDILSDRKAEMELEMDGLRYDLEDRKVVNERLNQEIVEKESRLDDLVKDMTQVVELKCLAEENLAAVEKDLEETVDKNAKLEQIIDEQKDRITTMTSEIVGKETVISDLGDEMANVLENRRLAEEEMEALKKDLCELMGRNASFGQIIAEKDQQMEALKSEMAEKDTQLANFGEELTHAVELRRVAEEKANYLEKDFEEIFIKSANSEQIIAVKDQQMAALESDLVGKEAQLAGLGENRDHRLAAVEDELRETMSRNSALEKEIDSVNSQSLSLKEQFSKLVNEKDEVSEQCSSMKDSLGQLHTIENDFASLESERNELKIKIGAYEDRLQDVEHENDQLNVRVKELEYHLQENSDKLEKIEHAQEDANRRLDDDCRSKITEYEDVLGTRDDEIQVLNAELEASNLKLVDIKEEMKKMTTERTNLETQVMNKLEIIAELNGQVEVLEGKCKETREGAQVLEEEKGILDAKCREFDAYVTQKDEESGLLLEKIGKLTEEVEFVREEVVFKAGAVQDIEAELRSVMETNQMMKDEHLSISNQLKDERTLGSKLQNNLEEIESVLSSLKNEKQMLVVQVERLQFYEGEYQKVVGQLNDADQQSCNEKEELAEKLQRLCMTLNEVEEKLMSTENEMRMLQSAAKILCSQVVQVFEEEEYDHDVILEQFNANRIKTLEDLSQKLSDESVAYKKKMAIVQKQLEEIARRENEAVDVVDSVPKDEVDNLHAKKVEIENVVEDMKLKIENYESLLIDERCRLGLGIEQRDIAIRELTEKVNIKSDENLAQKDQMDAMAEDINARDSDFQRMRENMYDEQDFGRDLLAEQDELKSSIYAERECSDDLRKELKVLRIELQKKHADLKNLEIFKDNEIKGMANELEKLKSGSKEVEAIPSGWDCDEVLEPEIEKQEAVLLGSGASEGSTIIIKELQSKFDNLKDEHDKLKSKSEKMFVKLKMFKSKSDKLSKAKVATEREKEELSQKLESQLQDATKCKDLMSESLEKQARKILEMTSENRELQNQFEGVKNTNAGLSETVEKNAEEIEFLEAENISSAQEIRNLKVTNGELQSLCENLRLRLNDLQKMEEEKNEKIRLLTMEMDLQKNKFMEVSNKGSLDNMQMVKMEEIQQSLSSEMEGMKFQKEKLMAEIVEKKADSDKLGDLKVQHDILLTEMEKAKSKIDEIRLEKEEALDRLSRLEASWTEDDGRLNFELEELRMKTHRLEEANCQLANENEEFKQQMLVLSDQLEQLQNVTVASKSNVECAEVQTTSEEAHSDDIMQKVAFLAEDEEKLKRNWCELEDRMALFEDDCQELGRNRQELNSWYAETSRQHEEWKHSQAALENENQSVLEHNRALCDQIDKLKDEAQQAPSKTESSELLDLTVERLRAELQRAIESIHHKDRICEEMKDAVAQLQEEKFEYLSKQRRLKGSITEDAHTGSPSSLNATIIEIDETGSASNASLSKPIEPITFVDDGRYEDLRHQLKIAEKEKIDLQMENVALNDTLSAEQRRRHDVQMELTSVKQAMNFDLSSPSKSDHHRMNFEDQAPLLYPETEHCLTTFFPARKIRSHSTTLRRWFRGRSLFAQQVLHAKSWKQLGYYSYLLIIHIWLFVCVL